MRRALVVDDDPHIVRTLEILLQGDGYGVISAGSAEEALRHPSLPSVDLALVDLQLPGISGGDLLQRLRASRSDLPVVIITAYGSIETAVEVMRHGAFDYLTKPFTPDQVRHRLQQIERVARLRAEVDDLRRRVGELPFTHDLVTRDEATLRALGVAHDVAATDATILVTGESGTGKTLLARLVHDASRRRAGPFVVVDCTSLHETLLESELFGHKRGAFTGAVADKTGKVETANGGTLLLDEVGEMPLNLQGKLLRLVEDRVYERLGDPLPRRVDARVIAATNRDLHEMVRERLFRQDLFYRLSVVEVTLPPLRNRTDDVLFLAARFLSSFSQAHGRTVTGWEPAVERLLLGYSWPGNVRELAHAIERAVLLASADTVQAEHLPGRVRERSPGEMASDEHLTLAEIEERHIRRALSLNLPQDETARRLGIDPSTLWRKRKRYGL